MKEPNEVKIEEENTEHKAIQDQSHLRILTALGIGLIGTVEGRDASSLRIKNEQRTDKGNAQELVLKEHFGSPRREFVRVEDKNILKLSVPKENWDVSLETDLSPAEKQKESVSFEEREFLRMHEFNSGERSSTKIMITYDDGGSEKDIRSLMDLYDRYNFKTTFFLPGVWIEQHPQLVKEIIGRGYEIGCHGWDHVDMTDLTSVQAKQQIVDFINIVAEIDPTYRVKLIRFPYGARNGALKKIAATYGLQSVMWESESGGNDEQVLANIMNNIRGGTIVLSHSNRTYDLSMASQVLEALRKQGFVPVTISEGMATENIFKENVVFRRGLQGYY